MFKRILSILAATTIMLALVQPQAIFANPYWATTSEYNAWYKETNVVHNVDLTYFLPQTNKNVATLTPSVPSVSNTVITSVSAGSPATTHLAITFADESANAMFAGSTTEIVHINIEYTDGTTHSKILTVNVRELLNRDVHFEDNNGVSIDGMSIEMMGGVRIEQMVQEGNFVADLSTYDISSSNTNVATVSKNAANNAIVITPTGIGATTIIANRPASADFKYEGSSASLMLVVNGSSLAPTDGASNVALTFDTSFDNFDTLQINSNNILLQYSAPAGNLTGYPGYTGNFGEYSSPGGFFTVTLYADFVRFLQQNNITNIPVVYDNRTDAAGAPTTHSVNLNIRSLNSYTVSFNANGGTGTMADVILNEAPGNVGVNYSLPNSTFTPPAGQQFARWGIEDPDALGTFITYHNVSSSYLVNSNVTFHAIWENIPSQLHLSPATGVNN